VLELYTPEALNASSSCPFKGNIDLGRLADAIDQAGPRNVSFVRMEATTKLTGGQPLTLENLRQIKALIEPVGVFLVVGTAASFPKTPISSASASPATRTSPSATSSAKSRRWSTSSISPAGKAAVFAEG